MYHTILPTGQLQCEDDGRGDRGVQLLHADGALLAFVPHENLEAMLTEAVYTADEPPVQ